MRHLNRPSRRDHRKPARLGVEVMEGRLLLSTIFVTNTSDGDTGSLRAAILIADAPTSGVDRINFAITGTGVHTIAPLSALPTITRPITIDGYSQPGASPNTLAIGDDAVLTIVLDGVSAGNVPIGLTLAAGGTTVRGLVISRFNGEGIDLSGPGGDTIAGDFLGIDAAGTTGLGGGANYATIAVAASNETIGGSAVADRNIVAAFRGYGIYLTGGSGTRIINNYMATDRTGAVALGGRGPAIYVVAASNVTIGGTTAAERNVISGSRSEGIVVQTDGNVVEGNYIGTDASGTLALGNAGGGLVVNSAGNTIGGTAPGAGNLLSGNALEGLLLHFSLPTAPGNVVQGNLIGTDRTGKFAIPNDGDGVNIGNFGGGGYNNTIGGTTPAARNVISGNRGNGISSGGVNSVFVGNYIGVDVTGLKVLPNMGEGIYASGTVGGSIAGAGNVIAGNKLDGVFIFTPGVVVQGNLIGLGSDGLTPLGNGVAGIVTYNDTVIGGTTAAARNVISANGASGIDIRGGTGAAVVQGNYIGTDASGMLPRGNMGFGVLLNDVPGTPATIGGTGAGTGNVISANGASNLASGEGVVPGGVELLARGGNLVQGNLIGLAADGKSPLGNRGSGVAFGDNATNNTVRLNTIAFNGADLAARSAGVSVINPFSAGNRLDANSIFSNIGLGIDLGDDGPTPNTPGGPHSGPNLLQNFPVITSVSTTDTDTVVTGTLNGAANTIFTAQFFANAAADPSGFGEGQTFLGALTDLATNADGNASFTVSLRRVITPGQSISATATDPAGNTSEFSGSMALVARSADVSVTQGTPSPTIMMSNTTTVTTSYDLTVTNVGPDPATGVTLVDTLSGGYTIVASNGIQPASRVGDVLTYNLGTLAALASVKITILLTPTRPGTITNGAVVSAVEGDPNAANNTAAPVTITVTPAAPSADLSVTGSVAPNPVEVNKNVTYTFTVSSTGPSAVLNPTLTVPFPAGVSIQSATSSKSAPVVSGNTVTAGFGTFAPGDSATVTIVATPSTVGPLAVTATLTSPVADPNAANNTATVSLLTFANPLIVTTTLDDGPGSLRAAIAYANANPGLDTISFKIPIDGIQTITPLSALPTITNPVIIDGTTQPGSKANDLAQGDDATILIEIDGSNAGAGVDGLTLSARGSTVRGLVIDGFSGGAGIRIVGSGGDAIAGDFLGIDLGGDGQTFASPIAKPNRVGVQVESTQNTIGGTSAADRDIISANTFIEVSLLGGGATANLVEGDYVGTNPGGTSSLSIPGGGDGVNIGSGAASNIIGGTVAGAGNVISGNARSGVRIADAGTNANVVEGNAIGTDATGTKPLGNAFHGVLIHRGAKGNVIGGTTPGARNVISANSLHGVAIADASTSGNLIEGDFIGTDPSVTTDLGNGDQGVSIAFDAFNNTVGGTVAGAGNTIAFNAMNGVTVEVGNGTGNAILANAIYGNHLLGIDLGNDGPTANTLRGPHVGPNHLQNYPVIMSALVGAEHVILGGGLNSIPETTFLLEFFMVRVIDASGHGQGQVRLGTAMATTDADGNATFSADVADFGGSYTATATDPGGNTSEFAPVFTPAVVVAVPAADLAVTGAASPTTANVGGTLTYTFTVTDNGPDPASGVILTDALPKGTTFVSASSSAGKADRSGDIVTAHLGPLASGGTATVTIVVAIGAAGASLDSATVTADQADPNLKNNRADVTVSATLAASAKLTAAFDGTAINLSWAAVPGAITYNVYRSTTSGAETLYRAGVVGAASFRDDAVEAGRTYDYQVTAVAGPIEGARSNEATAAVPPPAPPAPPTVPIRVFASLLDTGRGTFAPFVTWGYPTSSNATRFRVYRSSDSGGEIEITDPSGISAHDLIDRAARPGTTYTYRVTATSGGTESPRSAPARVTVPLVAAARPFLFKRHASAHPASRTSAVPRGPLHAPAFSVKHARTGLSATATSTPKPGQSPHRAFGHLEGMTGRTRHPRKS